MKLNTINLRLRPKPIRVTSSGDGKTLEFNGRYIHIRQIQRSGKWRLKTRTNGNSITEIYENYSDVLRECGRIFKSDLLKNFEIIE